VIPLAIATAAPAALARVLAWVGAHWRLALALGLGAALWWQTERLERAQADLAAREVQDRIGRAEMRVAAAQAGQEALTHHVDRIAADAPVAAAAARHLRAIRVCDPDSLPARAGAGVPDAAGARATIAAARAREAEARERLDAVAADLETCTAEMSRVTAWQAYYEGQRRRLGLSRINP
jgi:hypothetical protein